MNTPLLKHANQPDGTTVSGSQHPPMYYGSGFTMAAPSECRVKVDRFLSARDKTSKNLVERMTILVLILFRAQGLPITSGPFCHQVTPFSTSLALHDNGANCSFRRRRHRKWASFNTSKLMMANPEGTQQFRDRDLEFMFYDEAQVPQQKAMIYYCRIGPFNSSSLDWFVSATDSWLGENVCWHWHLDTQGQIYQQTHGYESLQMVLTQVP